MICGHMYYILFILIVHLPFLSSNFLPSMIVGRLYFAFREPVGPVGIFCTWTTLLVLFKHSYQKTKLTWSQSLVGCLYGITISLSTDCRRVPKFWLYDKDLTVGTINGIGDAKPPGYLLSFLVLSQVFF